MRSIIPFILALSLCLGLSLPLAGCGGGGAKSNTEVTTTTQGQALLDAKKAYDQGAITKDEYEDLKEKILDN